MDFEIIDYTAAQVPGMTSVWNEIVRGGIAFPQENELTVGEMTAFLGEQTSAACAMDSETGEVLGMYILHPNNVGRCGHVANASYAVTAACRGRGVGKALVEHSLLACTKHGFRGLQFNAVVADNLGAIALYKKLGFTEIGRIPGGFRKDSGFEDTIIFYHGA